MNNFKTYQNKNTNNVYTLIDFKSTLDGITYMFKLKAMDSQKVIEISDEIFNKNFIKVTDINTKLN